jgi:hypothetical protein
LIRLNGFCDALFSVFLFLFYGLFCITNTVFIESFYYYLQFLGYCVDLINKEFPHIHVVKGKPRKPTTQGSVEVSHKAFKEALTVWCNETGSQDWVYGSYIVQNKVNQHPMRSRGNISPHTLYYGHLPSNSYSTALGQAYGKADTEFGLRLAKKFLNQVNTHRPDAVVTQEHLVDIIELGDHAWDVCTEEEKTAMESEQMLYSTLLLALKEDFGIILEETPTFTLMEYETVEEMMQEELVWRSEMERYTLDLYSLSDEAFAVGGAPRDDQPDRDGT